MSNIGEQGKALENDDTSDNGTDTNFVNTDLTADGDRSHDFEGHNLSMKGLKDFSLQGGYSLQNVPYVEAVPFPQFLAGFDGTNDGLSLDPLITDLTIQVILNVDGTDTSPVTFTRTDLGGGNFVYTAPKQTGTTVTCVSYTGNVYTKSNLEVENFTSNYDLLINGKTIGKGPGGGNNTAFGEDALQGASLDRNTAIGNFALQHATEAEDNTAVGNGSLLNNTEGDENTGIGSAALNSNTVGGGNTAVGYFSLYSNTTGNYNTAVGRGAGNTIANYDNTTSLGYGAVPDKSNQVVLGNAEVVEVFTYGNVLSKVHFSSGDPTTTDIPDGFTSIWKNTTSGVIALWANNGGGIS